MSDWFQEGAVCVVTGNFSSHGFAGGTILTLGRLHNNCKHRRASSFIGEEWWVQLKDCSPYEFDLDAKVKEMLG